MQAQRQGLWATPKDLSRLRHGEPVPSDQHQDLSVFVGQGIEGFGEGASIVGMVVGLTSSGVFVQPVVEVRLSTVPTLSGGDYISSHAEKPRERFSRDLVQPPPGDEERLRYHVLRFFRRDAPQSESHHGTAMPREVALELLLS